MLTESNVRTAIIIPVHNQPNELRRCLESLQTKSREDCDIIVVDDASTDSTVDVAAEFDVEIIQIAKRSGPAEARNRGAQRAIADYLVFLDSDVCVSGDTINNLISTLDKNPNIDAVFGSYDTRPPAPNFVSQFRNLLHHYVHQTAREQASTFWAGCGAIRRSLFLEVGGFDGGFSCPSVEDIELGMRLRSDGRYIVLNKQAQVTHIKRWTLRTMFVTDLLRRGIPWSQLILREGWLPNDLNTKVSQRVSVILAYVFVFTFSIGCWQSPWILLSITLLLLLFAAEDRWLWSFRRRPMITLPAAILTCSATIGFILQASLWSTVGSVALLFLLLINCGFYTYLARKRSALFAALAVPLHIGYFVTCGLAFGLATLSHVAESVAASRQKTYPRELKHPALVKSCSAASVGSQMMGDGTDD